MGCKSLTGHKDVCFSLTNLKANRNLISKLVDPEMIIFVSTHIYILSYIFIYICLCSIMSIHTYIYIFICIIICIYLLDIYILYTYYVYIYILNTFTLLTCSSKSENYVERCAKEWISMYPCICHFQLCRKIRHGSGSNPWESKRPLVQCSFAKGLIFLVGIYNQQFQGLQ